MGLMTNGWKREGTRVLLKGAMKELEIWEKGVDQRNKWWKLGEREELEKYYYLHLP